MGSVYCTVAWSWYPFFGKFIGKAAPRGATRVLLRRNGWVSGLATVLERKERRPLLAIYCATYAIDSIWRRMEMSSPLLKKLQPFISALMLVASCSVLLHHHNQQPDLVTKWVLGFGDSLDSTKKT